MLLLHGFVCLFSSYCLCEKHLRIQPECHQWKEQYDSITCYASLTSLGRKDRELIYNTYWFFKFFKL